MQFDINAISDTGLVRKNNEDRLLIQSMIFNDTSYQLSFEAKDSALFAVADGMGGQNAGEVAAEMTLESLSEFIIELSRNPIEIDIKSSFTSWVKKMHSTLLRIGLQDSEKRGMGTTLTGLLFLKEKFYWFNAGDSRLYRLRNGILKQISTDHSLAQAIGNNNVPSNIIVNSIGGGQNVFIDVEDITPMVFDNDLYFLCSDGITDMIGDDIIEKYLNSLDLSGMVNAAKQNGGKDNISALSVLVLASPIQGFKA